MVERFTQRAPRSIVLAQEEARGEGHVVVAPAAARTEPDEIRTALDAGVPGPDDARPGPSRPATPPRGRGSR